MNADSQTQTLREAQKNLTRTRILDAALDLLKEGDLDSLTIAQVAAAAGMTQRTVFRHFATRNDMLAAVWPRMQARVGSTGFADTARKLVEMPLWLFQNFDSESGAVRASAFSGAGRELRLAVNDQRCAAFRAAVQDARPDLREPELTRLAAAAQLLNSAYAWAVMKDFWGLSGAEAGRAASDAISTLLGRPPLSTDAPLETAPKPDEQKDRP